MINASIAWDGSHHITRDTGVSCGMPDESSEVMHPLVRLRIALAVRVKYLASSISLASVSRRLDAVTCIV